MKIEKLSNYELEVSKYFEDKASGYDDVEKQKYWQLSDKLLWTLIEEQLDKLPKDFCFLDAGGGTGRWSKKILDNYPLSKCILVDMSVDMLKEANKKNVYKERWKIMQGDIQNLEMNNCYFDLVINTHNVLGFVENSKKAMDEMSRVLKNGGLLISVVPNKYHGAFFNLFLSNIAGAEKLLSESKGKFVESMPSIEMFSPSSIKELYKDSNIENSVCWGFPIFLYPGFNETQLKGESDNLKDILYKSFNELFDLEIKNLKNEEISSRGNNLFVVGRKE